jgi:hypothetical protein
LTPSPQKPCSERPEQILSRHPGRRWIDDINGPRIGLRVES